MKIGYARVSTQDQNLDMQIDLLKERGCEKIFTEKVSGVAKSRPELENMISFARKGDEIYVYKIDRLGRSLKHLVETVNTFKEKGVHFHSVSDGFILNDSATGQLMFNIFAAFAQFERDLISERTRIGLAAARARGRVGGRPKGLSKKAKDTAMLAEVLYKEGQLSVKEICEKLRRSSSTLYKYLRHRKVKIGANLDALNN